MFSHPYLILLWTDAGFVYLTSIMDLYSRKIIAWTLSKTLEVSCVIDTINKAKKNRKLVNPVIIHSDRGRQYVSKEYRKAASKMVLSYSKKHIHGIMRVLNPSMNH